MANYDRDSAGYGWSVWLGILVFMFVLVGIFMLVGGNDRGQQVSMQQEQPTTQAPAQAPRGGASQTQ